MRGRRGYLRDRKLRGLEAASRETELDGKPEERAADFEAAPGSDAGFWSAAQAAESFLGDLRRGRVREEDEVMEKTSRGRSERPKSALRPDTAVAPVGAPDEERYVTAMPGCCLRSLKEEALVEAGERRRLSLACGCGREWWITSTLDERVARRFVTHGGPRVGSGGNSAA